MTVDGPDVTETEFLEQQARDDDTLDGLFDLVPDLREFRTDPRETPEEMLYPLVCGGVGRMTHDPVEILGDRADVFGDAPFVIIQDGNEPFGRGLDIVERFVRDAIGEGSVARNANHVLIRLAVVTGG